LRSHSEGLGLVASRVAIQPANRCVGPLTVKRDAADGCRSSFVMFRCGAATRRKWLRNLGVPLSDPSTRSGRAGGGGWRKATYPVMNGFVPIHDSASDLRFFL
jgi:hypothetical protein